MNPQIEALAKSLEGRNVDGWVFTYEYPGVFQFAKENLQVCCTPDHHEAGKVDVQVMSDDGDCLDGWDVPYRGNLKADAFILLMRPELAKVVAK
jgi:hypothetical protein